MSAIDALTSNVAATANRSNGFGALNSEEFVKILITELANQDPFQPQDSAAILEQLSSLRNIEGQMQLQDKLESLVQQNIESQSFLHEQMNVFLLQNQLVTAGSTIGKYVEGYTADGQRASGVVTSVRVEDERVFVELDNGKTLLMAHVTHISGDKGPSADTSEDAVPTTVISEPVKIS